MKQMKELCGQPHRRTVFAQTMDACNLQRHQAKETSHRNQISFITLLAPATRTLTQYLLMLPLLLLLLLCHASRNERAQNRKRGRGRGREGGSTREREMYVRKKKMKEEAEGPNNFLPKPPTQSPPKIC